MITKKYTDNHCFCCPNCGAIAGKMESSTRNFANDIITRVYSCSQCDAFWAVEFSNERINDSKYQKNGGMK